MGVSAEVGIQRTQDAVRLPADQTGSTDVLLRRGYRHPSGQENRGQSRLLLGAMRALAAERGWAQLLAPVRPNWKARYPLTPIQRYAGWTRPDGLPFDPWLRVHARLGGRILRTERE